MTLADIDDAMGWSAGTARRYRWRDPERGGLPAADVQLGGLPLWFRTTIDEWRANRPGRGAGGGRPPGYSPAKQPAEVVVPAAAASASVPTPRGPEPVDEPAPVAHEPVGRQPASYSPNRDEPPAGSIPVRSGFTLDTDSTVVAWVHKAWRDASVVSADRQTVVVEYTVGDGPRGARQQRITVDRVRVPDRKL